MLPRVMTRTMAKAARERAAAGLPAAHACLAGALVDALLASAAVLEDDVELALAVAAVTDAGGARVLCRRATEATYAEILRARGTDGDIFDDRIPAALALRHHQLVTVVVGDRPGLPDAGAHRRRLSRGRLAAALVSGLPLDRAELGRRGREARWPLADSGLVVVGLAAGPVGDDVAGRPEVLVHRPPGFSWSVLLTPWAPDAEQTLLRAAHQDTGAGLVVDGPQPWTEVPAVVDGAAACAANGAAGQVISNLGTRLEHLLWADRHLADEFARSRLAAADDLSDELVQTLELWLRHPERPTAIARQLDVHVQTVRHRLVRLRSTLGAVLDSPAGRLELAVALRLRRMAGGR